MTDAVAERKSKTIAWGKPFNVEFRAPENIKGKWEITLQFDENNNIVGIQHPRDDSALRQQPQATEGGQVPEGGAACPPGQCGRLVMGKLMCSSLFC